MRQARRGRFHRLLACTGAIAALTIGWVTAPVTVCANDAADAKSLIDQAETTLKNFMSDPDMKPVLAVSALFRRNILRILGEGGASVLLPMARMAGL